MKSSDLHDVGQFFQISPSHLASSFVSSKGAKKMLVAMWVSWNHRSCLCAGFQPSDVFKVMNHLRGPEVSERRGRRRSANSG